MKHLLTFGILVSSLIAAAQHHFQGMEVEKFEVSFGVSFVKGDTIVAPPVSEDYTYRHVFKAFKKLRNETDDTLRFVLTSIYYSSNEQTYFGELVSADPNQKGKWMMNFIGALSTGEIMTCNGCIPWEGSHEITVALVPELSDMSVTSMDTYHANVQHQEVMQQYAQRFVNVRKVEKSQGMIDQMLRLNSSSIRE